MKKMFFACAALLSFLPLCAMESPKSENSDSSIEDPEQHMSFLIRQAVADAYVHCAGIASEDVGTQISDDLSRSIADPRYKITNEKSKEVLALFKLLNETHTKVHHKVREAMQEFDE